MAETPGTPLRKPDWLKIRVRCGQNIDEVSSLIQRYGLHTVCREANCPNKMECYSRRTATFLILGSVCTRNCRFCNIEPGTPSQPDPEDPFNLLQAVKELDLAYVVITSVTRDDLPDGGAGHFAAVVSLLKREIPSVSIEVLIPDFKGSARDLETVLKAGPDVLNHNVETVPRLYTLARPQAKYERSLELLRRAKDSGAEGRKTKSGLMVGLGESVEEVEKTIGDLRDAGCDFLTIGQYLAPSSLHLPVREYVHPETFARYRRLAEKLGFEAVASGPFVRSSYHAAEMKGLNPQFYTPTTQ